MVGPASGALRLTRALGLALAAYTLSLGAHLLGGGEPPSLRGTAVLLFVTWWLCVIVTGRRLGRLAVTGLLGLGQVLLHEALGVAGSTGACLPMAHAPAMSMMHTAIGSCARLASTVTAGMPPLAMGAHGGSPSLTMVVAHATAAGLLGLCLANGEAAVWFLASLVRPTRPSPVVLPAFLRPLPARTVGARRSSALVLPGGVGRRGPPRGDALVPA